jgi:tetratricopeptide (TPR) repeat protein
MNNILQSVTDIATKMIEHSEANDIDNFEALYKQLKTLCESNAAGKLNHPVQWETLADFTQDIDDSIALYKKALSIAEELKEHQYSASIQYSLAERYSASNNQKLALKHANAAKVLAAKYDDDVLQNEIDELLAYLSDENT